MIVNYATDQDGGKKYREKFDMILWHKNHLDSPAQVEPQAVSGVVAPVGSGAILPEEVVREQLAKIQTAIVAEREENVRAQLYQVYNELVEKQKQTNKQ